MSLLVLVVVVVGGYAWYTIGQKEPVNTINYQTQKVETVAQPTVAVTEEVAAVGVVETNIDAQLDSLENKSF